MIHGILYLHYSKTYNVYIPVSYTAKMTNGHWLVRRIDYSAVVSRNGYNNYEHFYHFFFMWGTAVTAVTAKVNIRSSLASWYEAWAHGEFRTKFWQGTGSTCSMPDKSGNSIDPSLFCSDKLSSQLKNQFTSPDQINRVRRETSEDERGGGGWDRTGIPGWGCTARVTEPSGSGELDDHGGSLGTSKLNEVSNELSKLGVWMSEEVQ